MISLIVAMSENRVIGVENRLPWHISDDLKRFKKLTLGHPMIMGRKTFDSIGKPLPGRANIVVTRNRGWQHPGTITAHSLREALERAKGETGAEEIFVIGGGEIFKESLPMADRIYLTVVHDTIQGDAYFPELDENAFSLAHAEKHAGPPSFTFRDLVRIR